jgi:hypothetical protein
MTTRRTLRLIGEILAIPLGTAIALGLMDSLRGLPGPALALALPLRETGHDDRASFLVVVGASALVFGLVAGLSGGRRQTPATALLRSAGVLVCALALQAVSLQLVRQASLGFEWAAAVRSGAPYLFALGAVLGTAAAYILASSDRWMRHGLQERPVDGASNAAPLAKIGS